MHHVLQLVSDFYMHRLWTVEDVTPIPHRPGMYHVLCSRRTDKEFIIANFTCLVKDGFVSVSSLATEHVRYEL
jgi:hypothetical protein